MANRAAYSNNGVYRCENFVEHLTLNNFPRFPIGSAGGVHRWYITFKVKEHCVYPLIHCNKKPTLVLRRFFRIIRRDGSPAYEDTSRRITTSMYAPKGIDMSIQMLANENYGYLDDDGGLTVEYGIHVDAILGKDKIWKFNFYENGYNTYQNHCQNQMIGFPRKHLYAHKQVVTVMKKIHGIVLQFSSKLFEKYFERSRKSKSITECFLQILHGVRTQAAAQDLCHILRMAHKMELHNVIQYCDQQLVRDVSLDHIDLFNDAIQFGLRHTLAYVVKNFESLEDLVEIIEQLDIEKMSGEVMKTFAAKIFTRKF